MVVVDVQSVMVVGDDALSKLDHEALDRRESSALAPWMIASCPDPDLLMSSLNDAPPLICQSSWPFDPWTLWSAMQSARFESGYWDSMSKLYSSLLSRMIWVVPTLDPPAEGEP